MKRTLFLSIALAAMWLLWSEPSVHVLTGTGEHSFLLFLGLVSVLMAGWLAHRMQINDEEGTPINLGLRPIFYGLWLLKEVVKANIEVTRRVLDPRLPIHPRLVHVTTKPKSELGRVILANSITLTPGTVSVDLRGERLAIHALSYDGAEEDLSGDMDRRVCELER